MKTRTASDTAIDPGLARTLSYAVERSRKPKRDITRETGIHKDALLRILRGTRSVTTDEALRLLKSANAPVHGTLGLALTGHHELACNWMDHEMGLFWNELLCSLPATLATALGEDLHEIRPRWATGTSKLIAKLLAEHVRDVVNRELGA